MSLALLRLRLGRRHGHPPHRLPGRHRERKPSVQTLRSRNQNPSCLTCSHIRSSTLHVCRPVNSVVSPIAKTLTPPFRSRRHRSGDALLRRREHLWARRRLSGMLHPLPVQPEWSLLFVDRDLLTRFSSCIVLASRESEAVHCAQEARRRAEGRHPGHVVHDHFVCAACAASELSVLFLVLGSCSCMILQC